MSIGLSNRRGSALILVLLMTLAVAGLSIAAIFLSSSAGLLSRFYDKEREFQLAAESALELVRSRLTFGSTLVIADTGVTQVLAGYQVTDAAGAVLRRAFVNVFASATGDTTGLNLPHVTLLAAAYDASGTRYVRRMDLRRESFSRYSLFADRFGASLRFGPGTVPGRVHTNETWRSGAGTSAATYRDTVSAVVGLAGTSTLMAGSATGVPPVRYPTDSTYPRLDTLAASANLSFAPVNSSGSGWRTGSRLEFVSFDADADGLLDEREGYARIFDLQTGNDTTRLSVGLAATDVYAFFSLAKLWTNVVVQNQCGAFYRRSGRWHFFPVATHRALWARAVIQVTGSSAFPAVNTAAMNAMDNYDYNAVDRILSQSTARCFPAGSPYLMTTERFTNATGVVTNTTADMYPFGTSPTFAWPGGSPYGGDDTTFTPQSRTCTISSGSTTGRCDVAATTLGAWKVFAGSTVSGVLTTVRQAAELPYLWPFDPAVNTRSRRVVHSSGGPLYLSGAVRGQVLLHVDGAVRIIERLAYATDSTTTNEECVNQLGVLAVGDVLVADNALTRGRRIARGPLSSSNFIGHFGPEREVTIEGSLMSVSGTVGVENATGVGLEALPCPQDVTANSSGGCLRLHGGMVMRTYSDVHGSGSSGMRYAGTKDSCQETMRRPPFFPLTNRYTFVRTLEVSPVLANTPVKIRAILMKLKGRSLD